MSAPTRLRAAVVGLRGMGKWHARSLHAAGECELTALCDLDPAVLAETAADFPEARPYTEFARLLEEEQPEIVAIVVPNVAHAPLTVQAAEAGVRGICCEKPMAMNLREATRMIAACERAGARLIINHQRRMLPQMVTARRLLEEGVLGEVQVLRGTCAGDLLTDGTHVVDSLLHLAGDADPEWVFGAVYREPPPVEEPRSGGFAASGGYRYGHPVETGAFGTWEWPGGVRGELFTGALRLPGRNYNDYEVLGTLGRLWRPGDADEPGLYLQRAGSEGWVPVALDTGAARAVISQSYDLLARLLRAGTGEHPLDARNALRGFHLLMGIYESARLRRRLGLPIQQQEFPLELLLAEGRS